MPEQPLDDELEIKEDLNENHPIVDSEKALWWYQWEKWVDKNAKPKFYKYPRAKRSLTRFQKRGPMSPQDWLRWTDWAAKKAKPKRIKIKKPPKPKPPPKKRGRRGKKEKVKRTKAPLEDLMPRILKLSVPKHSRIIYLSPFSPPLTFVPTINRDKPIHVIPRKVIPVEIKHGFADRELEADFWRDLRFPPCSKGALKYKISPNVLQLSYPKNYPPRHMHCKIPDPYEPPPRIKMSPIEWFWHLRHLRCLASPKIRLDPPELRVRRRKCRLNALKPRILHLSTPRKTYARRYRNRWRITPSILNATATPRVEELAQPVKRTEPKTNDFNVKKAALSATATPRVEELAAPKKEIKVEVVRYSKHIKYKRMEENIRCALGKNNSNQADEEQQTQQQE